MSVSDWIRQFRALHGEAKKGALAQGELEQYHAACDEFARALMATQKASLKPGELPRYALRIARAVQVELESPTNLLKLTTIDLGVGGFAAIVAKALKVGDEFSCKMKLPGGDPVETTVYVVESKVQPGSFRASFGFRKLGDESKRRIELLVIDTALSNIAA
jgi:hypothetical protein